MKKLYFIFFLLPVYWSCKNSATNQPLNKKEFEGLVTYRITYDNHPEDNSYGDTLKLWYSKGNLIKNYNGKAEHGIRKEIFLIKGNRYFFQVGNSDTLINADIGSDKYMILVSSQHSITDTRILGHTCEQVDQELEYNRFKLPVFVSYLYSKDVLPMDPDYFKNRKFSCFDRFIEESGVFFLRYVYKVQYPGRTGPSIFTFTAIDIKEQPVDPTIFNIDTSKVKPFPY